MQSPRTQAEPQKQGLILLHHGSSDSATAGITSGLVGFSFDKRSFCNLMDLENKLQKKILLCRFRQVLKASKTEQNEQNSAPHNGHDR